MKLVLLIFLTIVLSKKGTGQIYDSSKVKRIDFLNIDGEFNKANWGGEDLYYDLNNCLFGVFEMGVIGICGNDKDIYIEKVFINDKEIIYTEHIEFEKEKLISVYNEEDTLYFYMKLIPITEFLEENTNNGILVSANEIRINGKKPKMYFENKYVKRINFRGKRMLEKKLRNRYRGKRFDKN